MAGQSRNIFKRVRLRPAQFRTVANRRFDDAEYLRDSAQNRHANGAMYLGGFVIECILKAKLMEAHPWLQAAAHQDERWSAEQHRLWFLCHRSHDLEGILAHLKHVQRELASRGIDGQLREICGEWTIHARYSTRSATMKEAERFLDKVREIRAWLK